MPPKLNDLFVLQVYIGEGMPGKEQDCTVSLKFLARFKNCGTSSFQKGAVNIVVEGMVCLAALIDILPAWQTNALFL